MNPQDFVTPCFGLDLILVEGLQGEDAVSVDEIFGGRFIDIGDGLFVCSWGPML